AEGFDERSVAELAKLLEHPDMRVRQEAKFALAAKRGKDRKASTRALCEVARNGKNRLARIHAIWGLGQMARGGTRFRGLIAPDQIGRFLADLAADPDPEIRAQIARELGEFFLAGWEELLLLM